LVSSSTVSQRPARSHLRIATRASELALWQSRHVAARIEAAWPGISTELLPITTSGDRILDRPLAMIGGKGLFIKELEQALLAGQADIAVHSMKDVPWDLPPDLHIAVILTREDPRDVLVSKSGGALFDVPLGAKVGTSSLRRRSQLLALRPDLELLDLRGNVPTRLGRLERGDYDAIVLAAAGLKRLGLYSHNACALSVESMLPAVGQGAIGIECRRDDNSIETLIAPLHDTPTAFCVRAERAMNARLGGSCTLPVAGYAQIDGEHLRLRGLVAAVDGDDIVRQTASGPAANAEHIGDALAEALLAAGADRILRRLHEQK
jgi:hydroxymethylbilane synthase